MHRIHITTHKMSSPGIFFSIHTLTYEIKYFLNFNSMMIHKSTKKTRLIIHSSWDKNNIFLQVDLITCIVLFFYRICSLFERVANNFRTYRIFYLDRTCWRCSLACLRSSCFYSTSFYSKL